jgi:hypothetical protein
MNALIPIFLRINRIFLQNKGHIFNNLLTKILSWSHMVIVVQVISYSIILPFKSPVNIVTSCSYTRDFPKSKKQEYTHAARYSKMV